MEILEFKENLGIKELPKELENLIVFQNSFPELSWYSEGFEICLNCKMGLQYGWSDKEEFLNRLLPFAQANRSGSIYSIWINDNKNSLDKMPIVVFGDEGGVHVVAENILQLLHLLAYDVEICVDWDRAYFEKGDNYKESKYHGEYQKWIKENYCLEKIEKPEIIIKSVQEKYKDDFDKWFSDYYHV